jgi:hypothetical protein
MPPKKQVDTKKKDEKVSYLDIVNYNSKSNSHQRKIQVQFQQMKLI